MRRKKKNLNFSMELRPHQARILKENPDKALLVHEMRTGKSIIAKEWSNHPSRNARPLIICMKANKKEWQELCPHASVVTKEEFKKLRFIKRQPSCVVVDEAHFFAAPLFVAKKRSQLATALYTLVKNNPGMPILLLTATPLTNDPASLHTLMCYLGEYRDWNKFRNLFYEKKKTPFVPYPIWMPKKDWRRGANIVLKNYADIVSLSDCMDYLPPVTNEVIKIKSKPRKWDEDEEYHWTKDHIHEQTFKLTKLKELASGHRKLILVCQYTAQIDELAEKLKNLKPVYVLDGRTKDQGVTIKEAQEDTDCFLIVQAKIGFGWDGYMFDAMVFVSLGHRVIDHTQMRGRLTSVDYPKPQLYYYLVAGPWDRRIYTSIMNGEDFNIHKYDPPRSTTEKKEKRSDIHHQ